MQNSNTLRVFRNSYTKYIFFRNSLYLKIILLEKELIVGLNQQSFYKNYFDNIY
jgi:hypothetical protein